MRFPITDLAGHLAWTVTGVVWATWSVAPLPYGRRPRKEKVQVKDLHRALCRGLNGEALALGLLVDTDPVSVVERQLAGVDLNANPGWAEEAEANLDRLADLALGERVFYLSIPLSNPGRHRFSSQYRAAAGKISDLLNLPRQHPSAEEVRFRLGQAERVGAAIPAPFHPRPATVAEQVWIACHAQRRGMLDIPPPEPTDPEINSVLLPKSGAALPEPILDEGAKSDLAAGAGKKRELFNPLSRRVLKITNPQELATGAEDPASYQSLLVLSDTPIAGMVFPGSEILGGLDEWGIDADWAVRLRVTAREKVMQRNRQAVRQLNDQYEQRDAAAVAGTGHHELDTSWELLTEYTQLVSNDRLEVEVEHTVILAVPGHDAANAQERAESLARQMNADSDLKVESPVGCQEELWWAMQPGVPSSSLARDYAQITTSDGFAMMAPFVTTKLGGKQGPPFALNLSTFRPSIVHLNPGGYPELNISGSIAFVGVLGSGKSYAMKSAGVNILEMGGQMLAIDKSAEGEWATLAEQFPGHVVVDSRDPKYTMDPLRVMGIREGALIAQSTLTQLLDTSPQEPRGQYLAHVLSPRYLHEHELSSLSQVMQHLKTQQGEYAETLAMHMDNFAALTGLGPLLFDDTLPAPDPDAPFVVWRTLGMAQPKEEELATPHLYRGLSSEKIFGRAYYHLLVATARQWAFRDQSRTVALACDEAYDIFSNPQNVEYLITFIKEGRRANALLLTATHNPEDLGTNNGMSLIPTRLAFRCDDDELAQTCTRYLNIPENDPEFERTVEDLQRNISPVIPDVGVVPGREGECFIRDAFRGIGPAKILGPSRPEVAAALNSTPKVLAE